MPGREYGCGRWLDGMGGWVAGEGMRVTVGDCGEQL